MNFESLFSRNVEKRIPPNNKKSSLQKAGFMYIFPTFVPWNALRQFIEVQTTQ